MSLDAGRYDRKVMLFSRVVSKDALGTETEVDGDPVSAWANVSFGSGSERRELGQAGSRQTATFRVLSTSALRRADTLWQIEFDGARWGITSAVPVGGEANEIEFTATRKGA
jgi:head-tail adaptor